MCLDGVQELLRCAVGRHEVGDGGGHTSIYDRDFCNSDYVCVVKPQKRLRAVSTPGGRCADPRCEHVVLHTVLGPTDVGWGRELSPCARQAGEVSRCGMTW